jgi:16S rRNA G966 N2-methylase RsmD
MTTGNALRPIQEAIPADRQGAKRHYGVHPYFTRRPFNVVRDYITHYSKEGDRVLDPFGGSGVTAIEAFLENRTGIQNDINPLANFIAAGIANLAQGNSTEYRGALAELEDRCAQTLRKIESASNETLAAIEQQLTLPRNISLPSSADVDQYLDLFSRRQILSLAVLKRGVDELCAGPARQAMLLAWSATLTKLNKTFLSAEGRAESRGGSSIFSIYRYKIAKHPIELPAWSTFKERALNVIDAKAEIDKAIELKRKTSGWRGLFEVYEKDVDDLDGELEGKIDYIFTDPPYGGHISYLDLSILWNNWLGQTPSIKSRERELIVGGDLNHSESLYMARLRDSVAACVRMLKRSGWLSVVFQHWKIGYFEAILTGAAEAGAELKAAISQVGDPIWSMHKKKGNQSVLAGELILTFHKTGKPRRVDSGGRLDVETTVQRLLESYSDVLYGEQLFNQLVVEAWNASAIASLDISKDGFARMLEQFGWRYDDERHFWARKSKRIDAPTLWSPRP